MHQLGGVELVRGANPAQGGQEVEPARLELMPGQVSRQPRIGQLNNPEEASEKAQRTHVQVGPLPPPLREYLVDVVWRFLGHPRRLPAVSFLATILRGS